MRIAVIPGDGIGREVVTATLPLLDHFGLRYDVFGWGADEWLATGVGLPAGALEDLESRYTAVFLGALGDPRIPDMAHGREILLGLRRGLDLYVNHRPIPLPDGHVDIYRENTQGLYVGVGGTVPEGGSTSVAVDQCVYTRHTVQRFVRYCLERVAGEGRQRVTLIHKANAVPHTGRLWQEIFREELARHPGLTGTDEYVDAFCYHFVREPLRYQAVLAPNLFGDIVSDIGAALMGGLGLAASASVCPETRMALFEPVHGSAPDIVGTGLANPYAAAMSLVLLLEHIGRNADARRLHDVLIETARTPAATPDLGGQGKTGDFMAAVLDRLPADADKENAR